MLKGSGQAPGAAGSFSSLTVTNLTNGRFALVGPGGTLTDSASFTYSGSQMIMAAGSAGNPTLALGQTSLGFWGNGSNSMQFSAGGADRLRFTATMLRPETNGGMTLGTANLGWGAIYADYTITASGTTGNRTINKPAGTIRIAAAGTTVTLTNSLITANSLVFATLRTVDTTAKSAATTVSAGQCIFTLNAGATAEVEIAWWVLSTD